MSSTRLKRLQKELQKISVDKNSEELGIFLIDTEDLLCWRVEIIGPGDTPYEGGRFGMIIKFPESFPFKPPDIKFVTKIYHPNINFVGDICIDILRDNWAPGLTVQKTLLSIISLLSSPNPDDPLVPEIGQLFITNRNKFNAIAKEWTKEFAS